MKGSIRDKYLIMVKIYTENKFHQYDMELCRNVIFHWSKFTEQCLLLRQKDHSHKVTLFSVLQVSKDATLSLWLSCSDWHSGLLNTKNTTGQHRSSTQEARRPSQHPEKLFITAALLGLLWQLLSQEPSTGHRLFPVRQDKPLFVAATHPQMDRKQHLALIIVLQVHKETVCRLMVWSVANPHESCLCLPRLLARVPVQQQQR